MACEGSKTEKFYLQSIQRFHRLSSVQFEILPHKGTDPKTIVSQVANKIRQERMERAWNPKIDVGWAVFDGDEHRVTAGQRLNWQSALDQARALKIGLAITNPSMEFWYLIHFQDQRSRLTRQQASSQLKKHYPKYDKNLPMYEDLRGDTPVAIERARNLLEIAKRNGVDEHDNPCCWGLANLVERLIKLK